MYLYVFMCSSFRNFVLFGCLVRSVVMCFVVQLVIYMYVVRYVLLYQCMYVLYYLFVVVDFVMQLCGSLCMGFFIYLVRSFCIYSSIDVCISFGCFIYVFMCVCIHVCISRCRSLVRSVCRYSCRYCRIVLGVPFFIYLARWLFIYLFIVRWYLFSYLCMLCVITKYYA